MGLLGLYFQFRTIEKEANTMTGITPGWRTSEFWLTVLGTNVPALVAAYQGKIPPQYAALVLAAANFGYALLRTIHKSVVTTP
jgi:hypothetical protein